MRLTAAFFTLLVCFTGCTRAPEKTSRQGYVLGTVCSITSYGASEDLYDDIFLALKDIEDRMRVSGDSSEVARINAAAGLNAVEVSPDTASLIRRAADIGSAAPGTFDVTIGPLVALWGIGIKEHPAVPDPEAIKELLPLIGSSRISFDGDSVYLPEAGMGIDLGGIAKGYAADIAKDMLMKNSVTHALIDFGGNILTVGTKPDGNPWRIGIQDPSKPRGQYVGIVELVDLAAVTSGPYERFFIQDGVRYHHILDPATGYPAENGVVSATVITAESVVGDALSTMSYILGLDGVSGMLSMFPGTEAIIITREKEIFVTPGIQKRFTLADERYSLFVIPRE